MKKVIYWILMLMCLLMLAGCGAKAPAASEPGGAAASAEPEQSQTAGAPKKPPQQETTAASKTLPDSYPAVLPLAADAVIIDVRENPANQGLEVIYVSDNDIDTLCDFYEGALKDANGLSTHETADGYMISAEQDGVWFNIMLSENAMNPTQYAGKKSVYLIITGLEGIAGDAPKPKGTGEEWPFADLPGVPQLEGHIGQILREDGIIRLEITVDSAQTVKSYIDELTVAGFSFDTEPDTESDHMEFLAFKDSSMISFAYKGTENLVTLEYQK